MAAQGPVQLVEDAPGAAVRAVALPAALAAVQHRRVAAPVEEHQALLAAGDPRLDAPRPAAAPAPPARRGSSAAGPCRPGAPPAGGAADPLRQVEPPVAAGVGVVPALQRRRRRAEQHQHVLVAAAPDRQVARRVARAFLLLVRGVVLLVDDDQAEPRQRREHRQPGAEHDVGRAACAPPASGAGAAPASGRCAGRPPRRPGKRSAKRATSCGVRLISGTSTSAWRPRASAPAGGAQVDLGLAAAGGAVQQHRPRLGRRHRLGDALAGLGLGRRQRRRLQSAAPAPRLRRAAGACSRRRRRLAIAASSSRRSSAAAPTARSRRGRAGSSRRRSRPARARPEAAAASASQAAGDFPELGGRGGSRVRPAPDQTIPGDLASPERHAHQGSGREEALTCIAERASRARRGGASRRRPERSAPRPSAGPAPASARAPIGASTTRAKFMIRRGF